MVLFLKVLKRKHLNHSFPSLFINILLKNTVTLNEEYFIGKMNCQPEEDMQHPHILYGFF